MSKYMNEDLHAAICEALNVYDRPVTVIQVLAWLDAHPDQVPGRTITESDLKVMTASIIAYEGPNMEGRIQRHLTHFGVTVVPDPEPTNAEKLEATLLDTFGLLEVLGNQGVHNLAFNLDKAGVKAPGGDDDQ